MHSRYCTPAEERRVDAWRQEVANTAAPVVHRSSDRIFRNGHEAPVQVHVDDGLEMKGTRAPSVSYEATVASRRPRAAPRRPSSDHDRYPRRSSVHASSRAAADRYSKPSRHDKYDRYERREPSSKQGASIWSSLLPRRRSSRDRTSSYDRPARRTPSPDYVYRNDAPDLTVYSSRPRSYYAPQRPPRKDYAVSRSGTTKTRSRRDSFGVDDRLRMLDIRDRFREEIREARQWQPPRPTRSRRDYDRRSSYY